MHNKCPSFVTLFCQNNWSIAPIRLFNINTVEPVYNGHPRDFRKWPLNTGGRLIQA